ncbi:hypothetical protein [Pseudoduganella albidiflava]|uniref:DUF4345 domain-containing protein n=1 Tax=Pseudoduganella albidiflava TaxID=321983 RepID=A0A411WYH1_9BURK|nr:hypothetical protein [Pseudoduganella albidiflava]QBI01746.1 hypothetical protein EYF70_13460 [Pseudoduganella albidiflava]GGY40024.1 hypothetical protein GCM10007387_22720 [Pseudoduganella albidiflava]
MRNTLSSLAVGLIAWMALAALGNLALRIGVPGYALVEPAMQFSSMMLCMRLLVGVAVTLTAGMLAGYLDRSGNAGLLLGALFVLLFGANHVYLWTKFPVWFHLTFLAYLLPATVAGANVGKQMRRQRQACQQPSQQA